jgi:hypothetical protein
VVDDGLRSPKANAQRQRWERKELGCVERGRLERWVGEGERHGNPRRRAGLGLEKQEKNQEEEEEEKKNTARSLRMIVVSS